VSDAESRVLGLGYRVLGVGIRFDQPRDLESTLRITGWRRLLSGKPDRAIAGAERSLLGAER
jgi:hypothetical protein